jgi:hypothetical protein
MFGLPPDAAMHLASMYVTTARMNCTTAMMNEASATVPMWNRTVRQQLSEMGVCDNSPGSLPTLRFSFASMGAKYQFAMAPAMTM